MELGEGGGEVLELLVELLLDLRELLGGEGVEVDCGKKTRVSKWRCTAMNWRRGVSEFLY